MTFNAHVYSNLVQVPTPSGIQSSYELVVSISDETGTLPDVILQTSHAPQNDPTFTISGNFLFLAWSADGYGIQAAALNRDGQVIVPVFDVTEGASTFQGTGRAPSVLALSQYDYVVFWRSEGTLYASKYSGPNFVAHSEVDDFRYQTGITTTLNESGEIEIFSFNQYTGDERRDLLRFNHVPSGELEILGEAVENVTLYSVSDIEDADGLGDFSYQWQRDGEDIQGETAENYTLTQDDVGATISLVVSYTDDFGTVENVSSTDTTPILNINDIPQGTVTISGTVALHQAVIADPSGISDEDGLGTFSYQWLRNGQEITGATDADYRISGDDIGQNLTVTIAYVDAFGQSETVTSTAVSPAPQPAGFSVSVSDAAMDETGDTASFGISLNARPGSNVTLQFYVSNNAEARLLVTELTFTPDNWDIAQSVAVEGVDDLLDDGDVTVDVSAHLVTADPEYGQLNFPDVRLTNRDDGQETDVEEYGDNRANTLIGMNGNDRLYGEGGRDRLSGNYGNDRLYGGYGDDELSGGEGDDLLDGEQDDDTLKGGAGNDELFGGGADDLLYGGDGDDVIDGQTGADTMHGGAGDDTYYVDRAADVIRDGGLSSDNDTVIVIGNFTYELGKGLENATLQEDSGNAGLRGNGLSNELDGNTSDNMMIGGRGNDSIYAGGGNDTVNAGSGSDLIVGGSGAGDDIYRGGKGTDTIRYTSAEAGIAVSLKSGNASSRGQGDKAGIGTDQLFQIESVIGGKYSDRLAGNKAANELTGKNGKDILHGGGGADRLLGANGNDKLSGQKGGDYLSGGKGKDVLLGGGGADTFFFNRGAGRDTVRDFEVGVDTIEIGRGANRMRDLEFEQVNDNVFVSFANVEIKVLDTSVADLTNADNFLF